MCHEYPFNEATMDLIAAFRTAIQPFVDKVKMCVCCVCVVCVCVCVCVCVLCVCVSLSPLLQPSSLSCAFSLSLSYNKHPQHLVQSIHGDYRVTCNFSTIVTVFMHQFDDVWHNSMHYAANIVSKYVNHGSIVFFLVHVYRFLSSLPLFSHPLLSPSSLTLFSYPLLSLTIL